MKFFKLLVFVFCSCITLCIKAQPVTSPDDDLSKIYVKVYGSYGFLAPGSFKGKSDIITNEPVKFHVAKTGMGAGLRVGAGIGFIINEFINLGVDGEYLFGKTIRLKEDISSAESSGYMASGYSLNGSRSYAHEVVSVIPNIVFKAISKPTYYIYNRLGLVIGIPISMKEEYYQHYHYKNPVDAGAHTIIDRDIVTSYQGNYTLKPAVGYQFSLGTQVSISPKLKAFFEINAYGISFDRDKYEDFARTRTQVDINKYEGQQPTVVDHSKYNFEYINNGATGTNVKGVPFNYLTTIKYAQEPVIMNAISAGLGLAYRF